MVASGEGVSVLLVGAQPGQSGSAKPPSAALSRRGHVIGAR